MSRGRLAAIGVAFGLIASQAGHLVAFQIRYGPAAERLQSIGAHAYFPALVKTGVGLAAAFAVLALIAIGFARVVAGRKLEAAPALSLLRLLAMLFCLQLTCFIVQETIEMAAGAPATSAPSLLLWGTAGQLPVALAAALALRWLAVRIGPAMDRLLAPPPVIRLIPLSIGVAVWPIASVPIAAQHLTADFNRRGPPY
ncbi:MAG TPA: hypothetical protein VGX27_05505 [Candidatus Dormibacteraeota bacterium]|nr:hypothetical protein [Candidatus Dormibacteraeota bacterium]